MNDEYVKILEQNIANLLIASLRLQAQIAEAEKAAKENEAAKAE